MLYTPLQIEGTWEQIAALAESLSGYRLRLTVLTNTETAASPPLAAPALSELFAQIREQDAEGWDDLPSDLAEQHDHYIYGTPKK